MRFGFSWVGLVFLVMLFVPNGLWTRMKPEGYDERLHAAQLYEAAQKDGKTVAVTATEYIDIIHEIRRYDEAIRAYDATLLNGEVEIELPCLSEDVLMELMTTNGWTAGQMMAVGDVCGKQE